MKDIYQGLNAQQLEVVKHRGGSCIAIAGPGSGKTRSITTRAAALVREGVPPEAILMLTFTRASYQTMLKRAKALDPRCEFLTIGTYHAVASKVINQNFHLFGKDRPFTILDGENPATIISEIMEPIKGTEKNWPRATTIAKIISFAVNTGRTIEETMNAKANWAKYIDFLPHIQTIAEQYGQYKYQRGMIDYDDCLQYFGALLVDPQIGPLLRQRWKYVMGDEHQDTNVLQLNIVQALAMDGMDIMVVGDPSQCLPEGEPVLTPMGEVPIETIKPTDKVLTGVGNGNVGIGNVQNVHRKYVETEIVSITTESGKTIRSTPEHVHFAGYEGTGHETGWCVYLMYRRDLGYRIGMSCDQKDDRQWSSVKGFKYRTSQEGADHCFVLSTGLDRQQARVLEQVWSLKYAIPTLVFYDRGQTGFGQEYINEIFSQVDGRAGAKQLLNDLGMMQEWPHHRPKAMRNDRANFSITQCAEVPGHRFAMSGSQRADEILLQSAGLPVRSGKNGGWRLEGCNVEMREIMKLYERVRKVIPHVNLIQKAKLAEGGSIPHMAAANCKAGMAIYVYDAVNATITKDRIASVKRSPYAGYVYDIDVDRTHNFISNGVVTHNSIYGFRGSAPATMTRFHEAYPNSRILNLEKNYRSTPEIIDLVNAVDKKMGLPFQRTLQPGRPSIGQKPVLVDVMDTAGEAAAIVESILKDKADGGEISDHAILVRSMLAARRIEIEMVSRQIPYRVMGGIKINEALHVRDLLDILRLTQNVQHEPAWMALLTRFPKMGPKGARPIIDVLMKSASMAEAIDYLESGDLPTKVSFQPLADALRDATISGMPAQAVQEIIGAMKPIWSSVWFEDWENRLRDLDAINTIAEEYGSISDFITALTLDGSYDKATKDQAQMPDEWPLTISTIHSAKGLEWKHVHIPGFTQYSIPSVMAETDEEMAEEWRVFFVAVSRAERTLRLYKPRLSNNGKIIERSVFEDTIRRFMDRENGVKSHQISAGPIDTQHRISIPGIGAGPVAR